MTLSRAGTIALTAPVGHHRVLGHPEFTWAAEDARVCTSRVAVGDRALTTSFRPMEICASFPNGPGRNKLIDLVVTDREGRRLAIEADGDVWHQDIEGHALPEDLDRQALLEEASIRAAEVALLGRASAGAPRRRAHGRGVPR
jgi:hypothetical protein